MKIYLVLIAIGVSSTHAQKALVYSTTYGSAERITQTAAVGFEPCPQPLETDVCIFVDPTHRFQSIIGFGGALTDAAAETFAKLPKPAQDSILDAYYDPVRGIGYTFGRTNINSCDFSSGSYTYVDDNDSSLRSFSISHDLRYKIPLIKKVNAVLNGGLTLFASPWSPPAWMKDNHDLLHGGRLKKEFYKTWATYMVKFIQAYQAEGISVWGITVQNEPMNKAPWESCNYSVEEERDFVKAALGPAFTKHHLSAKKIIAWDQNRDLAYPYAGTILNDPRAAKYVWGVGLHWYETWTKSAPLFDNVGRLHEAFPGVNLVFTEGCIDQFDYSRIGDWSLGEQYAHNMLNDLNNGVRAWCDWNILLDHTGGPNHTGNFCFAPVIGDVTTGKVYFTNEFWYIGQFSKFIRPGAVRITAVSNRDKLEATAFVNKDRKIAVVVLNRNNDDIDYHVWMKGFWTGCVSKAHSIQTVVIYP